MDCNGGLELKSSRLHVGSQASPCSFFVEMITIAPDDDSVITVENMISGLTNYKNVPAMEQALDKLIPFGYSVLLILILQYWMNPEIVPKIWCFVIRSWQKRTLL